MKILSAEEIRNWDQYTIREEPVTSINLMERAAHQCVEWLDKRDLGGRHFAIFCGKGNNGGDGLAIARMLSSLGNSVSVYILEFGHKGTDDFQLNLQRLHQFPAVDIHFIQTEEHIHPVEPRTIVVDALMGSGLNRPLDQVTALLVNRLNQSGCPVIAIDIPSGLYADRSSKGNAAIRATHTLSFQCYKPAFLVAENAAHLGDVHILNIGLHPGYYASLQSSFEMVDDEIIRSVYKPRQRFAHKGMFGHAGLVAGSTGFMGAAVLSARACVRSGAGKLTCYIPKTGYEIIQTTVPEAMARISGSGDQIEQVFPVADHAAIGVGPGIGVSDSGARLLEQLFAATKKPMVVDADALTILSKHASLIKRLPAQSILTPHPGEFERLYGPSANDFDRIGIAMNKARESNLVIVLKGHHTLIATPGGKGFFNNTGNAGMATGGSGDVLTGMITGLLAQGYDPVMAAILGVYLHGLAGDLATAESSQEAMIAGDIIDHIGEAFRTLTEPAIPFIPF